MKSVGIVRHLDKLGRIVLPKELRDSLDIQVRDDIEYFHDTDNSLVVLRKFRSTSCFFCAASEDLIMFKEQLVCKDCARSLVSGVGNESIHEKSEDKKTTRKRGIKWEQLQNLLRVSPDISRKEIAEALDVSLSRVSQMFKVLAESSNEETKAGNQNKNKINITAPVFLKRKIVELIEDNPAMKQKEIAAKLNITQGYVSQLLKKMKE
ncbi:winged helix-turn-helix transcriptional regulator [Paenibacillus sp. LS1]|nr:winged helix-turn-helix transcriptional regulator [Paenibacillus sp. LS1]